MSIALVLGCNEEGIADGVTRNELGCIATYSFFLTSVPSFDI